MMVSGGGTFGRYLGHGGGDFMSGISALTDKRDDLSLDHVWI